MNLEAHERHNAAEDISAKISDISLAVLEVGSVAYAPNGVRRDSDLDLVGILDFSKTDFGELYHRLGQQREPLAEKYAKEGRINTFSVVWDTPRFEIGLHLWDKTAFDNVVAMREDPNIVFGRESTKNFKSTAPTETLYNLQSLPREFAKQSEEVEGGRLVHLYPFREDETGFYPGIQLVNLALAPTILFQQEGYATGGLLALDKKLRGKLQGYRQTHEGISFCNGLCPTLREKIPESLRRDLSEFY